MAFTPKGTTMAKSKGKGGKGFSKGPSTFFQDVRFTAESYWDEEGSMADLLQARWTRSGKRGQATFRPHRQSLRC